MIRASMTTSTRSCSAGASRSLRCAGATAPLCTRTLGARGAALRCSALPPHGLDPLPSVASHNLHSSLWASAVHHANVVATLAEDAAVNTAAAAAVARTDSGPFDFLAIAFENVLEFLDEVLEKGGVPYSYGFAIILLTMMVKLATFPLSQKQVQSTVALQALQPRVRELQARYANDAETLQLETAKLYRDAGVNPLAGCLPTLATIPVFIGLYRALTLAAQDNLLDQDFFWIPSLSGPASLASQAAGTGLSWLFPFVDGHPPIGWGPAASYLVLPVLLVVSQYVSQRIISPSNNDPQQQQAQAILKFLPLMIGWFSLNVPAGLTLYWFVNNILSTAQQVYLKSTTKVNIPDLPASASSSSTPYISPKEEKVKRVTGKDLGARRTRRREDEDVVDVDAEVLQSGSSSGDAPSTSGSAANGAAAPNGASGGKGDKFRARKAREAASKAATIAAPSSSAAAGDQKADSN